VAVGVGVIVLIALFGSLSDDYSPSSTAPSSRISVPAPLSVLPIVTRPSKLATQAHDLMSRGSPQAAIALLEEQRTETARDPDASLQLGHAHAAVGRLVDAIADYELAVGLDDDLIDDTKLRANVVLAAESSAPDAMLAGLDFQAQFLDDTSAQSRIVALASSDKRFAVRKQARELAHEHDVESRIDSLISYSLDLEQAPSCEERRDVIAKLASLRDKRAIKPIKRARHRRRGGFLGLGARRVNACLIKEADAALAALKSLPDP
jgi:hypothetical protein